MSGACLSCGTSRRPLDRDHCHKHGTPRGLLCHRCNVLMSVIDRGLTPRLDASFELAGLLAHAARCPECPLLAAADLQVPATEPMTIRLPDSLKEWLRVAAFERRESQNAIIIRAIEREKELADDAR